MILETGQFMQTPPRRQEASFCRGEFRISAFLRLLTLNQEIPTISVADPADGF
jgi:hypothetical protein